jgi:hypothetical protein
LGLQQRPAIVPGFKPESTFSFVSEEHKQRAFSSIWSRDCHDSSLFGLAGPKVVDLSADLLDLFCYAVCNNPTMPPKRRLKAPGLGHAGAALTDRPDAFRAQWKSPLEGASGALAPAGEQSGLAEKTYLIGALLDYELCYAYLFQTALLVGLQM